MIDQHRFIANGRTGAIILGIALAAGVNSGLLAQEPQGENGIEEVTVTGTRIKYTDGMSTPTPVTSMVMDELMSFEPGGTVAEQMDALPQFFLTQTGQRGGPALYDDGGGAALDMRGLGGNRTLVLLDGSRIAPTDKRGTVNVENLPTVLIRSVDVVTGGASAAYGADALGGVVNFVLNREFEGIKFSAGTGLNEFNGDGKNYNFSFAGGTAMLDDKLHVIASLEMRHMDQITRDPEELGDWFQRWGVMPNPAYVATDPPGTKPRQLVMPWVTGTGYSATGKITGVPSSSRLNNMKFTDDGSEITPYILGDLTGGAYTSGGPEAHIAHLTQAGGPAGNELKNHSGFLAVKYDLADNIEAYAQILRARTESNSHASRMTASMSGPWAATVFRNNAYLPDSVAAIMDLEGRTSFRLSKQGSYLGELDVGSNEFSKTVFTTTSWSVGFNSSLPNDWSLNGSWQSGTSDKDSGRYGGLRVDRLMLAMDAVRDTNGRIVCNVQLFNPTVAQLMASPSIVGKVNSRDGTPLTAPIGLDNTVRDCVPFNIMGTGQISQAAADYIMTPKIGLSTVKQDYAEILLSGELYEGWGYGPVSFASGFTYRKQSFDDGAEPVDIDALGPPLNDTALGIRGIASIWSTGSPNLHQFSSVALISGKYDVWEWFGELNAPLWESDSGEQRIGASAAYRRSTYDNGGIDAYKLGLDIQAFSDLRIRATRSRDVREASFTERFDYGTGGGTVFNPWLTGRPSVTITSATEGNAALNPEKANTTVLGLVYQTSWLEGLRMSLDWYKVDISDSIALLSTQEVVDQCFDTGTLCEYVRRDSSNIIGTVIAPYLNMENAQSEGVDFEVAYSAEPDFFGEHTETFGVRVLGGYTISRSNTPRDGSKIELAGARSRPDLKVNVTANYRVGPFAFMLQQRYLSSVLLRNTWIEGIDIDDNHIDSSTWTNMRIGYHGSNFAGWGDDRVWRLEFSINNLFDQHPPVIAQSDSLFGSQAVDGTYDEWGRRYELTLSLDL